MCAFAKTTSPSRLAWESNSRVPGHRKQRGPAIQKLESLGETEVMISVFVVCELRAVTAKKFGMPVLTRDVEHFGKIPGLAVVTY